MSAVRLHYFNVRNRAEHIRWILAYKHIAFEDIRIDNADWPRLKETFEFHQIPVLEIDGHRLVTAIGIGRYLAQGNGLYPTDFDEIYSTESLIDYIGDFLGVFDKIAFKDNDWPGWDAYLRGEGVQKLKYVEARLKANHGGTGFFIGAKPSLLDFVVAAYVHSHYFIAGQEHRLAVLAAEVPALKAFVQRFTTTLPEVANYIATRPASMA
jgi:glutathione S-transferase